jgi:hypothetical protein
MEHSTIIHEEQRFLESILKKINKHLHVIFSLLIEVDLLKRSMHDLRCDWHHMGGRLLLMTKV